MSTFLAEWERDKVDFDLDEFDGKWIKIFATSTCITNGRYVKVRLGLFLAMALIFGASLLNNQIRGTLICWPIFLTNWSLLVCVAYLFFAVVTTARGTSFVVDSGPTPWYAKAAWVLQGIALPASFLVTVGYWGLVVDYSKPMQWIAPFTHGVNFILMVVDNALKKQPFYLVHGVFLLGYLIVYLLWSGVHYLLGFKDCENNPYIYRALNWGRPSLIAKLSPALVIILVPIVVLFFWVQVRIRNNASSLLPARARAGASRGAAKIAPEDSVDVTPDK